MPFTPFHLGPALCLAFSLRKYITHQHSSQPTSYQTLNRCSCYSIDYTDPLHGYLHTFIAAIGVGITFGLIMYLLERPMKPLYKSCYQNLKVTFKKVTIFITAGVLGHVSCHCQTAPIYFEIKPVLSTDCKSPLWTGIIQRNPATLHLHGVIGIIFYALLIIRAHKKPQKNQVNYDNPKTTFKNDYQASFSVSPQTSTAKLVNAQCQPLFSATSSPNSASSRLFIRQIRLLI